MPADQSEKTLKKRKPPSCDRCKAKRVLCHPAPPGESCPRCLENEVPCTTTPVVRRRPVRKAPSAPSTTNNSASPDAQPLAVPPHLAQPIASGSGSASTSPQGASPESLAVLTSSWAQAPGSLDELPKELLINLFDDFKRSPQASHPALPHSSLRKSLECLQWRTSLLPPDLCALTYCILASAALISLHPLILGPGPIPATPQELNDWPATTDWSSFGRRREGAYRALRDAAFRLGKEAEVTTEPNACNVATCYLLDFLSETGGSATTTSRPYARAYMAHARALAESRPEGELGETVRWSSFMANEAVRSTQAGAPIFFSPSDQKMLHGDDTMSLEQLETILSDTTTMRDQQPIFAALRPYGIYVIDVARKLDDNVSGSHARRRPLAYKTLTDCMEAINRLGDLYAQVNDRLNIQRPTPHFSFFPPIANLENDLQAVLQSVRIFFALGYTGTVLSLHSELQRRAREEAQQPAQTPAEDRQRERVALVTKQVKDMVRESARDWARAARDLPSVGHATHFRFLHAEHWALVLLEEVQETGILSIETSKALESILFVLKLIRFSHIDPSSQPIIDTIEWQLRATPTVLNLLPASTAPNPFLPIAPETSSNADFLQAFNSAPPATSNLDIASSLNPPPDPHFSTNVPLDLGQLESDFATAHGTEPSLSFMDGMGMEEWFSTAMLGSMGGEQQGFGLEVPSFAGSSGGFEWGASGSGSRSGV